MPKQGRVAPGRGERAFAGAVLLATVAAVWLLGGAGAFGIPNGYLYDAFMSLGGDGDRAESTGVLIVEAPHGDAPAADGGPWRALVAALAPFEPARIVFTFRPGDGAAGRAMAAAGGGRAPVILGREAWPDGGDGAGDWSLAPAPDAGEAVGRDAGLVVLPPAERGVWRRQRTAVEADGRVLPTIELLAARDALGPDWEPPGASYLVDFRGGVGSLPKLGVEHALSGGLVEDLVRGRTVLVGFGPEPGAPRVHTPLLGDHGPISRLEFHGFALRTLLAGAPLAGFGPAGAGLALLATAAAGVLAYRRVATERLLWLMLAAIAVVVAAGYALFRFAGLFPPVTELVLAQLVLALAIWHRRDVELTAALRALTRRASGRLPSAGTAGVAAEPWAEAAGLAGQTLDLERSAFLRVEPGGTRVREAATVRCAPEDIAEHPRDVRRPPYATAIAEGGAIALDEGFFRERGPDEEEYMVPLVFAGEVIGFWAFAVDAAVARNAEGFRPTVAALAERIATHVHLARRRRAAEPSGFGSLLRRLGPRGGTERELRQAVELLGQRLDLLQNVLSGGSTAAAAYDVLGTPRYANERMAGLARAAGVDALGASALDLVAAVAGAPPERARRLLRSVLLDRRRVAVASARRLDDRDLLLSLAPAPTEEPGARAVDAGERATAAGGVLCELLDVTPVAKLLELKETVARHLDFQLRNDLESVTLAANLLADPRLPAEKRGRVLEMMQAAVRRSRDKLGGTEAFLAAAPGDAGALEVYPLDPREPVEAALDALAAEARRRRVALRRDFPAYVGLVLAGDRELRELVGAILSLLLQDARDGGAVAVAIAEQERTTTLAFNNSGFGLPEERLREYLFQPGAFASSEFQAIRAGLPRLEGWHGAFAAQSRLGEGLAFEVTLRKAA